MSEAKKTTGGKTPDDTLNFLVNNASYTGWLESRATRGLERCPNDFEIVATDPFPGENAKVIAKPGDPCKISLGNDTVLTGYVDRVSPSISPRSHLIRISGRGKCQDLTDCAALIEGCQVYGTSALLVAQQLVKPFAGISVSSLSGDGLGNLFQFAINLGETVYQIIERMARYEGLLPYEDENGNLVLSRVGTLTHASGITEDVNLQTAAATFSMDQRFDRYVAAIMSTDRFSDIGTGGNVITTVYDKSVLRYRPTVIVSEQSQNGVSYAKIRAEWELARRRGQSQSITVEVDSWRDSAGKLWTPNYLVPVHVPSCKVLNQSWCISQVSYLRTPGTGRTARLTLAPPEAFSPEPPQLQLLALQVAESIHEGNPDNHNLKPTGPS